MATAAFLVSIGGTSYAAVMITGANVKNGSLAGVDVKDSSLEVTELSSRARAALRGQKGDVGVKGDKGDTGAAGAAGAPGAAGAAGTPAVRLWAVVENPVGTPTIARSSGTTGVISDVGTGRFRIEFNQSIAACSWQATAGSVDEAGALVGYATVELENNVAEPDTLRVGTYGAAGTLANRSAHIAVLC
jgi:hypothetical protein